MPKKESTTGLTKEAAAALSYVLGPLTGIIFVVLEHDHFVRFHAMQSVFALGGLGLFASILWIFPPVSSILWLMYVLTLLIGAYHASQGKIWEAPIVGKFVKSMM